MLQALAFFSWKNIAQRLARAHMDVILRWRQQQQYQLSVGFHCWAMLSRVGRDPRLRSALESVSSSKQELRLSQATAAKRFVDAEAEWRNLIELGQSATQAESQRADTMAAELRRMTMVLEDTLELLQQAEADKQRMTVHMREREQGETERMAHKLRDLHRKIDEDAGEREANLQALMIKDKETACLLVEVESLRAQVQFFARVTLFCRMHVCFTILIHAYLFIYSFLQLQQLRSISNSATSEAAENSTLVLELQQQLQLAKAERSRAEESEASARELHAAEMIRAEHLDAAKQALMSQVHLMSLEATAARANAAKEKSLFLERLVLAEDGMMDWKRQHDELSAQLDNSGRLRILQQRISALEQKSP